MDGIFWEAAKNIFYAIFENQFDGLPETVFCFFDGFTLPVSALNRWANSPVASFRRGLNDCCKFRFHF
jgi:hypothetical protein